MRNIRRTAGQIAYVGGIIHDTTGADLTTVDFKLSFGTQNDPGTTWYTPDLVEDRDGGREVKALIPTEVPDGEHHIWIKAVDLPEVDLLRVPGSIKIT